MLSVLAAAHPPYLLHNCNWNVLNCIKWRLYFDKQTNSVWCHSLMIIKFKSLNVPTIGPPLQACSALTHTTQWWCCGFCPEIFVRIAVLHMLRVYVNKRALLYELYLFQRKRVAAPYKRWHCTLKHVRKICMYNRTAEFAAFCELTKDVDLFFSFNTKNNILFLIAKHPCYVGLLLPMTPHPSTAIPEIWTSVYDGQRLHRRQINPFLAQRNSSKWNIELNM